MNKFKFLVMALFFVSCATARHYYYDNGVLTRSTTDHSNGTWKSISFDSAGYKTEEVKGREYPQRFVRFYQDGATIYEKGYIIDTLFTNSYNETTKEFLTHVGYVFNVTGFYANGKIRYTGFICNNQRDSTFRFYNQSNGLDSIVHYKNNQVLTVERFKK